MVNGKYWGDGLLSEASEKVQTRWLFQSQGVWSVFREEQGVAGQLLLNKPWPLSVRPHELIGHEMGRAQVRNEGHWVTKRTESNQEGQDFTQPTALRL